jgi:signal transduction histidine kinase
VDRTYLSLYHDGLDSFETVAWWDGEAVYPMGWNATLASENVDRYDSIAHPSPPSGVPCPLSADSSESGVDGRYCRTLGLRCPLPADSFESARAMRYCLPLSLMDNLVGLLHIDVAGAKTVTRDQMRSLTSVAPEMALAIENLQLDRRITSLDEVKFAEQRRIAQDLHDTLGQNVTYLRLKLDQLSDQGTLLEIASIRDSLEKMREVADEAYHQVRGALVSLEPVGKSDLVPALRRIVESLAHRSGVAPHFFVEGNPLPLPGETQKQILAICREAFNNIEKHACARVVSVKLLWGDDDLTITISDDGCGFSRDAEDDETHFGLSIMQERGASIDGKLRIDSAMGAGTTLDLWVPIPDPKTVFQPPKEA